MDFSLKLELFGMILFDIFVAFLEYMNVSYNHQSNGLIDNQTPNAFHFFSEAIPKLQTRQRLHEFRAFVFMRKWLVPKVV